MNISWNKSYGSRLRIDGYTFGKYLEVIERGVGLPESIDFEPIKEFRAKHNLPNNTKILSSTLNINTNFRTFCSEIEGKEELIFWLDFNNTYENWFLDSSSYNKDILIRKYTNLNADTNAIDICKDQEHQYFQRYYFYLNIIDVPGILISFWNMITEQIGLQKPMYIRTYQYDSANVFGQRLNLKIKASDDYL